MRRAFNLSALFPESVSPKAIPVVASLETAVGGPGKANFNYHVEFIPTR